MLLLFLLCFPLLLLLLLLTALHAARPIFSWLDHRRRCLWTRPPRRLLCADGVSKLLPLSLSLGLFLFPPSPLFSQFALLSAALPSALGFGMSVQWAAYLVSETRRCLAMDHAVVQLRSFLFGARPFSQPLLLRLWKKRPTRDEKFELPSRWEETQKAARTSYSSRIEGTTFRDRC